MRSTQPDKLHQKQGALAPHRRHYLKQPSSVECCLSALDWLMWNNPFLFPSLDDEPWSVLIRTWTKTRPISQPHTIVIIPLSSIPILQSDLSQFMHDSWTSIDKLDPRPSLYITSLGPVKSSMNLSSIRSTVDWTTGDRILGLSRGGRWHPYGICKEQVYSRCGLGKTGHVAGWLMFIVPWVPTGESGV